MLGWVFTFSNATRKPLPCSKILVKTYCGDYDLVPANGQNISANPSCMSSSTGDMSVDTFAKCCGRGDGELFQTSRAALAGIVHLWRDPADNLMARFHRDGKAPKTIQNFQNYVDKYLVSFMRSYTSWHCNLLFMSKERMPQVPVLSYDYDNYSDHRGKATVEQLLHFLDLKRDKVNGWFPPFKKKSNYSSWYTPEQYAHAKRLGIIYHRKNDAQRLQLDCGSKTDFTSLIFIKPHKVGGTTIVTVLQEIQKKYQISRLRVGEKFDLHNLDGTVEDRVSWISEPGVWTHHCVYSDLDKKISQMTRPHFLLTWMRDPVERCLSAFYWFAVTVNGEEASDDNIIKFARSDDCRLLSRPFVSRIRITMSFILTLCEKKRWE